MKTEEQKTLEFILVTASEGHHNVIDHMEEFKAVSGIKVAYIAGKVTGLEYDAVYNKFKKRELELVSQGYVVINPCDHIGMDCEWKKAMKICLMLIQYADVISLLHDWQDSKGATIEKNHADILGIEILN